MNLCWFSSPGIPCAIPPEIANGIYNPSPSDEYYVGLTVTYLCDRDYSLIGDSTIECEVAENGVDGIWNMLPPECKSNGISYSFLTFSM